MLLLLPTIIIEGDDGGHLITSYFCQRDIHSARPIYYKSASLRREAGDAAAMPMISRVLRLPDAHAYLRAGCSVA